MVTSTSGVQSANPSATFTVPSPTPSTSIDSFTQQLLTAIEGFLDKSGSGSQLETDIQAPNSQNSDGRQLIVTLKQMLVEARATNPLSPRVADAAPVQAAVLAPRENTPATPPNPMDECDAYWAGQPSAVQALRDMSPEEASAAASALAAQGYTIDVPIMVWGGDPLKVMQLRQSYGYTWVPSALQDPVQVAPGLTFPTLASYDPKHGPAGSIRVNTDFAPGAQAST